MVQGMTSAKLKEKINALELEAEEMVKRGAKQPEFDLNRRKVRTLRKWLEEAEKMGV